MSVMLCFGKEKYVCDWVGNNGVEHSLTDTGLAIYWV